MAGTRKKPLLDPESAKFLPSYYPECPQILREVFRAGGSIAAFCARVGIGRTTFYDWIDNYPEFKASHTVALEEGRDFMQQMGMRGITSGSEFNFNAWNTLSKRMYAETDARTVRIPELLQCNSAAERQEVIIEHLAEGKLTSQEARDIAQIWLAGISIEEHTRLMDRIKALEELGGISVKHEEPARESSED